MDAAETTKRTSVTGGSNFVFFNAHADRSYCCSITAESSSDSARLFSVTKGVGLIPVPFVTRGNEPPALPVGSTDPQNARVCFEINETGKYLTTPLFGAGGDTANNVEVRCDDTTLFGGFNTSISNFNFLELSSLISGGDIQAKLTVKDSVSGQTLVDKQTIQIPAGVRVDIALHNLTGPGKFGSVTITHDAPVGGLKAVINQYKVTSTQPFDFEPVVREVLTRSSSS